MRLASLDLTEWGRSDTRTWGQRVYVEGHPERSWDFRLKNTGSPPEPQEKLWRGSRYPGLTLYFSSSSVRGFPVAELNRMKESERALIWFTQVSLLGPELAREPGRLTWNRVQSEGGWIWTSLSDPLGEYETLRKRLYFSNLTFRYFLIAGTQRSQVISCTRNFMQTPVSKDAL